MKIGLAICRLDMIVLVLVIAGHGTASKCLNNRPEVLPKRHFYFNSTSLPIKIETSNRPSQQLVSRILRILLKEVLGYSKVELCEGYNSMDTRHILNRLSGNSSMIPETMVNVEMWVQPGFNLEALVSQSSLINAGPLGPSGRFGWFIPKKIAEEMWNLSRISIDHWKALRLPAVTSLFSLHGQLQRLSNFTSVLRTKDSNAHCDDCHRGIYYPPNSHCRFGDNACAVLLSSYPGLDGQYLKEQITNLQLNVGIAWLGEFLNSFIEEQMTHESPVLFFNWVPNDITATGSYTRMLFPTCQTSRRPPIDCDFDVHQLSKMVWSTIKSHTPEAYHLISRLELTQNELDDLLILYRKMSMRAVSDGDILEQAACSWVQENSDRWMTWIPENLSSKTPIYLGGMFPLTGPYWRQPGIVPGAQMAVEYVNSDDHILPDYELVLLVQDTQCKVDIAMTQFLQYVINKTHPIAGILGPGCSETAEPVAGVSKHFNTIVISYSAEAVQLTNRVQFPLFFRTIPHILQNGIVYMELFRYWRWEQVALLAEDGQSFPEYHAFLKDLFQSQSIQITYDRKMPRQAKMEDAAKYIEELKKKDVKIIILTSFEQAARAVVCQAYREGMVARNGYVWFLPSWFTETWWMTDMLNQMPQFTDKVPCSSEEMKVAVQGHFLLSTAYIGNLDSHIVGNTTVKQWLEAYLSRMAVLRKPSSAYASYAYDAVLVFALSLHKLLTQDPSSLESLHTEKTVQRFMYYLNNTHFSGVSGPVKFSGADRTGIINIEQYIDETRLLIGQFLPDNVNTTDRLLINDSAVTWLTGDRRQPTDGRLQPKKCSVEGFRLLLSVECDTAIVVANVIGIGIFGFVMIVCLIVVKKRYDVKVREMKQKIDPYHLLDKLDKWQIPRDRVVINRKIGEGTSGTVYGGEANINNTWVAVAVKTINDGATMEEKLDILSEAEMMKQFDHENIVKLLGVCTVGDPIYMIMEFMLHGDLKTFLLARRHMVGQMTIEAEDVSPRGLTKMALDVANGLKYLASLNYVHRDVACRNCLVHAGKTVRIGDFGMTKNMYDKDYYQFSRKGKFPVRWMAPESIADGIFTTASDVWSYGVLLYEIMTFGSFPYQGRCNNEVLELVKAGKTIEIPQMCPQKLKSLLTMDCWNYYPKNRPSIGEIINRLEDTPELIVPCLDSPSAALALDCVQSHQVNLQPNFRSRMSRGRPSFDHSIPMRTFSVSSHEMGSKTSDDECSPDSNVIDPFVFQTRPTDPPRKVNESHSLLRFSFDSFRKSSLKANRSHDGQKKSDIPNGTSCGYRPQTALHLTHSSINAKHAKILSGSVENCQFEEDLPMNLPPSIESKADSDYCSQHSKNLEYDQFV